MTVILLHVGFISNPGEEALLAQASFRAEIVNAFARVIAHGPDRCSGFVVLAVGQPVWRYLKRGSKETLKRWQKGLPISPLDRAANDYLKTQLSGSMIFGVPYRYRDRNRYRNRLAKNVSRPDFDPDPDSDFDFRRNPKVELKRYLLYKFGAG